jgi:hypothetical protein
LSVRCRLGGGRWWVTGEIINHGKSILRQSPPTALGRWYWQKATSRFGDAALVLEGNTNNLRCWITLCRYVCRLSGVRFEHRQRLDLMRDDGYVVLATAPLTVTAAP